MYSGWSLTDVDALVSVLFTFVVAGRKLIQQHKHILTDCFERRDELPLISRLVLSYNIIHKLTWLCCAWLSDNPSVSASTMHSAYCSIISCHKSSIFTVRRVCTAQTMPWQDVCLSVRPSHAGIVCKRLHISSKFFHCRAAPSF